MHTALCDDDHEFPVPSFGLEDKLDELYPSFDLWVEPKLNLFSVSELHESREPRFISSEKEGCMRSVLGLLELTNDISLSGGRSSPYDLFEAFPLVNGDLQQRFSSRCLVVWFWPYCLQQINSEFTYSFIKLYSVMFSAWCYIISNQQAPFIIFFKIHRLF